MKVKMIRAGELGGFLGGEQKDRVVPPTGNTARLTLFASAAMSFLCVFAIALSLAAGRLADRWHSELTQSITIRISAPVGQADRQVQRTLQILDTTPGVTSAAALSKEEHQALLSPWFGPDLPVHDLPIPQLINITTDQARFDTEGLRQRLSGEVPGAVLDDHMRWRAPLVRAAERLRLFGVISILLIAATTAIIITLAANAALAANSQVIQVLRMVGAMDNYIARAFVRRFTLRAFYGAFAGMVAGSIAVALLPAGQDPGNFLTGLGFAGWHWLWPLVIPPLAATVAFVATRYAAHGILRDTP